MVSKLSRPGPELVYNLEIYGEHVYHVGDGVLVHNSCGRRGGPDHIKRILDAAASFEKKGWIVVSGGLKKEIRTIVDQVTKKYRYADLVLEKNGKQIAIQVGRATKNGPVPREVVPLKDLRKVFKHVFFLKYN